MSYDFWKLSNGYTAQEHEDLIEDGKHLVHRWTEYLINMDEDDRQGIDATLMVDANVFLDEVKDIEDESVKGLGEEITDLMSEALG